MRVNVYLQPSQTCTQPVWITPDIHSHQQSSPCVTWTLSRSTPVGHMSFRKLQQCVPPPTPTYTHTITTRVNLMWESLVNTVVLTRDLGAKYELIMHCLKSLLEIYRMTNWNLIHFLMQFINHQIQIKHEYRKEKCWVSSKSTLSLNGEKAWLVSPVVTAPTGFLVLVLPHSLAIETCRFLARCLAGQGLFGSVSG